MTIRSIIVDNLGLGDLKTAVNRGLDIAADDVEKDVESHTSTWKTSVSTEITTSDGKRKIVVPEKVFRWVDHGTKPHVITPKRKKALSFKSGSQRKTTPGRIPSGSGSAGGKRVTVKQVVHPGSKASNFSDTIKKKYDKDLALTVQGEIDKVI